MVVSGTPQAAYIHVPFCRHRCGYCNFTVVAGREDLMADYLRALELELKQLQTPRPVQTIFIGGGTPTRLPLPFFTRLLELVQHWFPLAPRGEWTIEANPEDIDSERVERATELGVTRWSLGVQSFLRWKRRLLERPAIDEQIDRALEICRRHATSLAVDLIFAVPGESVGDWEADLSRLLEHPIDHVSTYTLTVEKGTSFWSRQHKGTLTMPGETEQAELYRLARRRLRKEGFEHYEISNYARPGHRCRHNEIYWQCEEYYAVGPGAARYVGGVRETNHRSTTTWMRRVLAGVSPVAERETIDRELAARERLIFGLRMLEGIDVTRFAEETGYTIDALAGPAVDEYVTQGWLVEESGRLKLTEEGILISDALWPSFLR